MDPSGSTSDVVEFPKDGKKVEATKKTTWTAVFSYLINMFIFGVLAALVLILGIIWPFGNGYRIPAFESLYRSDSMISNWVRATGDNLCFNFSWYMFSYLALMILLLIPVMFWYTLYDYPTDRVVQYDSFWRFVVQYQIEPVFRIYWAVMLIPYLGMVAFVMGFTDIGTMVIYSVGGSVSFVLSYTMLEYFISTRFYQDTPLATTSIGTSGGAANGKPSAATKSAPLVQSKPLKQLSIAQWIPDQVPGAWEFMHGNLSELFNLKNFSQETKGSGGSALIESKPPTRKLPLTKVSVNVTGVTVLNAFIAAFALVILVVTVLAILGYPLFSIIWYAIQVIVNGGVIPRNVWSMFGTLIFLFIPWIVLIPVKQAIFKPLLQSGLLMGQEIAILFIWAFMLFIQIFFNVFATVDQQYIGSYPCSST